MRGLERERRPRFAHELQAEADSLFNSAAWCNTHKAAHIMGAVSLTILNFPDSEFDKIGILILAKAVEAHIDLFKPSIIYTHFANDLSVDHRRTNEAVVVACRPKPGHPVKELFFFEVASSTEWQVPSTFQPNLFISIDDACAELKERALTEAYGGEMRGSNHPRSVDSIGMLGFWRGASCGHKQAEAFVVGRIIR